MTRHWTINSRFLSQPATGVQRYARNVVQAIDALLNETPAAGDGIDIDMIVQGKPLDLPAYTNIKVRTSALISNGHLWEQVVLPGYVRGGLLSLCNTGPVAVRQQVVCIHDVNTHRFPQSYSLPFRALYGALLPALGRRSRIVTTVSEYSKAELASVGICALDKIRTVSNGHEHVLGWRPQHNAATHAAAGPDTIVMIGSAAQHKNIGLILGLAGRLSELGLRIAVVGATDKSVFAKADSLQSAHNVLWLGRVDDDALAALLGDCLCLAFPSFTEGFGLPPLEAMTLGCPVVASNTACMPEICGDAVLYASPSEPDAWLLAFSRLRSDQALWKTLSLRGRERARRYSWRASAASYLALMRHLDGVVMVQPEARLYRDPHNLPT